MSPYTTTQAVEKSWSKRATKTNRERRYGCGLGNTMMFGLDGTAHSTRAFGALVTDAFADKFSKQHVNL